MLVTDLLQIDTLASRELLSRPGLASLALMRLSVPTGVPATSCDVQRAAPPDTALLLHVNCKCEAVLSVTIEFHATLIPPNSPMLISGHVITEMALSLANTKLFFLGC